MKNFLTRLRYKPPPATNNFYRAWRSPKKVLMQKSQKFYADCKYVNLKIELLQIFEKKSFSSLFLMRKPLSSDQKWFLRPYFPLIGGIFVLKSGLRFLFRGLEVSIRKVRKSHFLSLLESLELFDLLNIWKSMTYWKRWISVSHAKLWIQEMLAHLKRHPILIAVLLIVKCLPLEVGPRRPMKFSKK